MVWARRRSFPTFLFIILRYNSLLNVMITLVTHAQLDVLVGDDTVFHGLAVAHVHYLSISRSMSYIFAGAFVL